MLVPCDASSAVKNRQRMAIRDFGAPTLIFFSLPFWKNKEKPTKTARIRSRGRTPKILGKQAKNAQKGKDFLEEKKARKSKTAKKRRSGQAPSVRGNLNGGLVNGGLGQKAPTKCSKSRDLVRLRFAIRIANRKSLAI